MDGTVARIAEAVTAYLDALDDAAQARTVLPMRDEAERRTWFYWPGPRRGLPVGEMSPAQQTLAHHVVAEVLSLRAYAKVQAIIGLERVLDEIEQRQGSRRGLPRDPALYHLSVFGEHRGDEPWGLRFEGHHVSLHVSIVGGRIACTPCFLGANPAAVLADDGRAVVRPLAEEEDVARELVGSVGDAAIVSPDAPDDILTTNVPRLGDLPTDGVPLGSMSARQRGFAERLIEVYVSRMHPDVAGAEMDRLRGSGVDRISFAWAGSVHPGERHYYRLVGPTFLVEYDNTQDDANHIHAVWRDRERDFGEDLLRAHVAEDHAG